VLNLVKLCDFGLVKSLTCEEDTQLVLT